MRRRVIGVAIVVAISAIALICAVFSGSLQLGAARTGDSALGDLVREEVGDRGGYRGLEVAWVDAAGVRFAGLGSNGPNEPPPDESTPFEIGSVTKALTGMLLVDMIRDGSVHADQPLRAPGRVSALPRVGLRGRRRAGLRHVMARSLARRAHRG